MTCFPECGHTCGVRKSNFDATARHEVRWDLRLQDIVANHVGWYLDSELDPGNPHGMESLGLDGLTGVYILWRQGDFCDDHELEHLRAQYVGKGQIAKRLARHWAEKAAGGELATEISVWVGPNRQAKYVEQLLLDTFSFPLNKSENPGTQPLCHHVQPAEWN